MSLKENIQEVIKSDDLQHITKDIANLYWIPL
jgi:hypothetical protein